ncbi:MAG: DTW domain-containing protein [Myxococcaceae bacterium]|nr:DTW domain-containing protein [Myxococcaceae bacterium]
MEHRALCLKCRRPKSVCWCHALVPMASATRVVFVQHPRESRVPVSTCRMAHLSLPNSELHVGMGLAKAPPDAAVLFPSDDAVDVAALDRPPGTLVVVDGTWSNAKKVVQRDPVLRALPRVRVNPTRPGNYRIRKEPSEECLSTIEAVALVLGLFEGQPEKFQPILSVFDRMVNVQLEHIGKGASRHARWRERKKAKPDVLAPLRDPSLVIAYGEGNGLPAAVPGERVRPELVQLVALRVATGERFEVLVKPRRTLAPHLDYHLGVSTEALLAGLSVPDALARWRAFTDGALVATWGSFTNDLLDVEGERPPRTVNLKHLCSQHVFRSTGGIEAFAQELGHVAREGDGRAARRLAALAHIVGKLPAHKREQDHTVANHVH